jgi:hypothetical protein
VLLPDFFEECFRLTAHNLDDPQGRKPPLDLLFSRTG